MSTTMNDETWIELFIIELRLRRVPGAAIGDAVASVRELVADSGQSAEAAFGSAREYAGSLDIPELPAREQAMKTVLLPVLGLFGFIVFVLASSAWIAGEPILLSVPQVMVLSGPLVLTLLFALPFYPRAVLRRRWLPAVLVLLAGACGAVAALLAPASPAEAWTHLAALPVMIVAMAVLVVLGIIGTVITLRSADSDEITDPRESSAPQRRGRRGFLVFVDWLFPMLGVLMLGVIWGMQSLRG